MLIIFRFMKYVLASRCSGRSEPSRTRSSCIGAGDDKKGLCVVFAGIVKAVRGIGVKENRIALNEPYRENRSPTVTSMPPDSMTSAFLTPGACAAIFSL